MVRSGILLKHLLIVGFRRLAAIFGVTNDHVVFLEGGLGSQILNVMAFWNLQGKLGEDVAKCNLSYFRQSDSSNFWPWRLDAFGIKKESFAKFESNQKFRIFLRKKDWVEQREIDEGYWANLRAAYSERFSFDPGIIRDYFAEVADIALPEHFGVVHFRRGDYLKVASKLVTFEDYMELLELTVPLFPRTVLFISDSPFSAADADNLCKLIGSEKTAIFLDNPDLDAFKLHCILRMSDVLVTANSTFSFSAALLGKVGQKVFSPLNFHAGENAERYNSTFRPNAGFVVWKNFQ